MKPDMLINEVDQLLTHPEALIAHLNILSGVLSPAKAKKLNPKWETPAQIKYPTNQIVTTPPSQTLQELRQAYGANQTPEQQRFNPFLTGQNRAVAIVSQKSELFFSDFHGDLGSFLLALPEMLEALEA